MTKVRPSALLESCQIIVSRRLLSTELSRDSYEYFTSSDRSRPTQIVRQTLLRYVRLMSSQIGLPSVCDVRAAYSEGSTFRYNFSPPNNLGTRTVCVKILVKKLKGTPCSKKVSPLIFDNDFGKCGRFLKFFHQVIRKKILYVHITKISISPAICCYTIFWKSKIQKWYQIFTLNVTINMCN